MPRSAQLSANAPLQFILADVELDRVPLHIATPGHLVWLYGGH
jgi:hypothetical protein